MRETVYLIGIDLGTTALKVGLFDSGGRCYIARQNPCNLDIFSRGRAETDIESIWSTCLKTMENVIKDSEVNPRNIRALAISCQGGSFVPVNGKMKPLRKAIISTLDTRSQEEVEHIKAHFSQDVIFNVTGQAKVIPFHTAAIILWMKREEVHIFKKTHKYLTLQDYFVHRFTGRIASEYSLNSCSLLLDIKRKCWWEEMLNFIGISPVRLPELTESGTVIGKLSSNFAGLRKGTIVISGGLDQACGLLSSGNIYPGIVTETTGTVLAISTSLKKPLFDSKGKMSCYYHVIPDTYFLMAAHLSAGRILEWFKEEFCQKEMEMIGGKRGDIYEMMTTLAEKAPPDSNRLIFLPYLLGSGCPQFNPYAKGVFFGITLNHNKGHFIRAIMESISFVLAENLDVFKELGIKVKEVRSLGGGAKNEFWLRIKSDIIQKSIVTLVCQESALLGAAMLAAKGMGIFNDFDKMCGRVVSIKERIMPDSSKKKVYQKAYTQYLKLSQNLEKNFFKEN